MDRVTRYRTVGRIRAAALVTALALVGGSPLGAQEEERRCRCVDPEGQEIENCTCFTVTPPTGLVDVRLMSPDRAAIGVRLSTESDVRDEPGVVLTEVTPGSPAEEAGLRAGDVVVSVDGRSVVEARSADAEGLVAAPLSWLRVQRFVGLVGGLEPGEEVELEYLRDGERRTTTIVPERRVELFGAGDAPVVFTPPDEGPLRFMLERGMTDDPRVGIFRRDGEGESIFERMGGDRAGRVWVRTLGADDPCATTGAGGDFVVSLGSERCVDGIVLQDLNPELAEYFEVSGGVLVLEVAERSGLGLRAGDVIRAVGGRDVEAPSDVRRILGSYEDDETVTLRVVRHGEEIRVRGTRR